MTTKVVTTFESDPLDEAAAEKTEDKYDFSQVFEALQHSKEVAENVFARCSKRSFRKLLTESGEVKMLLPGDSTALPVWVVMSSVTLNLAENWTDTLWPKLLDDMIRELAGMVVRLRKDKPTVRLIGPLSTKVAEVGQGVFTFSAKQQWGLHD